MTPYLGGLPWTFRPYVQRAVGGYARKWLGRRRHPYRGKHVSLPRRMPIAKRWCKPAETKYYDASLGATQITSAGGVSISNLLHPITQGDGDSQRSGRNIYVKSMFYRLHLSFESTSTPSAASDIVRILLVHDKYCAGAVSSIDGIITTTDILAFNRLDQTHRFRILYDRKFLMGAQAGSYDGAADQFGQRYRQVNLYRKFKYPLKITYDATAGVITDLTQSNVVMYFISELNNVCTVAGSFRVRYCG